MSLFTRKEFNKSEDAAGRGVFLRLCQKILDTIPAPLAIFNEDGFVLAFNLLAKSCCPQLANFQMNLREVYDFSFFIEPVETLTWEKIFNSQSQEKVSFFLIPKKKEENLILKAEAKVNFIFQKKWIVVLLEPASGLGESTIDDQQEIRKKAEDFDRINDELKSFSYAVSHDLRSPLRAISGFSEILLEEASGLDPESQKLLSRIKSSAEKMNLQLEALLKLNRLGRRNVVLQMVDLSRKAKAVADQLRSNSELKNIRFEISEGMQVMADPDLVEILFQCLIENSMKFNQGSDQELVIRLFDIPKGSGVFCLEDNGVGFRDPEDQNLMTVFHRQVSADEVSGIGAGLAVVKKVMNSHRGQVWIKNSENGGAQVYFSFDPPK